MEASNKKKLIIQKFISMIQDADLSDRGLNRIDNFLSAMSAEPTCIWTNPKSDIADARFTREFSDELLQHHSDNIEPINKFNFENVLVKSFLASDRDARRLPPNKDKERQSVDILMNDQAVSAKTEAALNISANKIHISKLNEAKWIRYCRSGEDCVRFIRKVMIPNMKKCDRTFILRAFRKAKGFIRYELEEVPREILLAIGDLKAEDFGGPTPNNTRSARVTLHGRQLFTLTLDGSVEKVMVRSLSTSDCTRHAVFNVPITKQRY
jgi:hypothetical protein